MTVRRILAAAVAVLCVMLVVAIGQVRIPSPPLPFTRGTGPADTTVTVTMANVSNLVPHAEVLLDDVEVGSVKSIVFDDWKAKVTLGIDADVVIPEDAQFRVGQKTLLGAQHVDVVVPAGSNEHPLATGAVVPEEQTATAVTTEQILTAAGALFSGGGLESIATISRELNAATHGREADWRRLLREVNRLLAHVDDQRDHLARLVTSTGRLGGGLESHRSTLTSALDTLPDGLDALAAERKPLLDALAGLAQLSDDVLPLMNREQRRLVENLANLAVVAQGVAGGGKSLAGALGVATFPFPLDAARTALRGDYINIVVNLDLTLATLDHLYLGDTPLEGLLVGLNGRLPATTSAAGDPLSGPLDQSEDQDGEPAAPEPAAGERNGQGDETSTDEAGKGAPVPVPLNPLSGLLSGLLGSSR